MNSTSANWLFKNNLLKRAENLAFLPVFTFTTATSTTALSSKTVLFVFYAVPVS